MDNSYNAFIDIIKVLNEHEITYNEVPCVLKNVWVHIKQSREMVEYNSVKDYYNNNKSCDIGNMVVEKVKI